MKLPSAIYIHSSTLSTAGNSKASFRDFSLNKVMFTLQTTNNPNGYANSHSVSTGFSTLNLTYCYIHTNRHKMMHFTIILRQQQRRQGDPNTPKMRTRHKIKGEPT